MKKAVSSRPQRQHSQFYPEMIGLKTHRRWQRSLFRGVMGIVLLLLSSCATTKELFRPRGTNSATASPKALWELPDEVFPSQRLYRVKYKGPDDKAGFKLTLYLQDPSRYRMQAADGLGRKLWTLDVEPQQGGATWVDHRNRAYCRLPVDGELGFLPIARLPIAELPKLILGRMPATPAANLERNGEYVTYLDSRGQLWNGAESEGHLSWWSLLENGKPIAWWRREEKGGSFVHRRTRQELNWQELVHETLLKPVEPLMIPGKYREGTCEDLVRHDAPSTAETSSSR